MDKNQIVTLRIEDMGNEGEGIGKVDGFTLFVKGAVAGDLVKVKVLKAKKSYGYAKVEEILEPSPDRVAPVCPVSAKCGGCQLQQISYKKQLEFKNNKVRECITRIGGIAEFEMEDIIGMDDPFFYRNKAQYPVGVNQAGEIVTGFYAGRTHAIISSDRCYIQHPVNEYILKAAKEYFLSAGVKPYDEASGKGLIRHILTRVGYKTGELMVCLVINGRKIPMPDVLVEKLKAAVDEYNRSGAEAENGISAERMEPETDNKDCSCRNEHGNRNFSHVVELVGLCLNVNTENTNVILGNEIVNVYGKPYIEDYIGDVRYRISPLSFYQVNPVQTVKLYNKALEYAGLTGNETVWDLYCGIGTISLFLAKKAKMVYGVEIIPAAIENAKENAKLNKLSNTDFFVGAAEDVLPAKYAESNGVMRADVIVVDPPRKGCDEVLLDTIVKMQPDRIVYVSCDPATLARDLKYLDAKGYKTEKACAVDQFCHTGHVEIVCLLTRKA